MNNFTDQGSYDNGTWYPSVGAFDWTAVDKFEIVSEQGSLAGKTLFFDNITITNLDTARIFETSAFVFVNGITITSENGSDSITTAGGTLQMLANIVPLNATIKTVHWKVNDTTIAEIDENGLLRAKKDGVVTISAWSMDGSGIFGSTTVSISIQITSYQNAEIEQDVVIYPIPVDNGVLYITQSMGSAVDIAIYNMYGQQLLYKHSDEKMISLDVSKLNQGSYIIKIAGNDKVATNKFVIYGY